MDIRYVFTTWKHGLSSLAGAGVRTFVWVANSLWRSAAPGMKNTITKYEVSTHYEVLFK